VLKGIFYISSALNLKRSWQAMRLRKANIRVVDAADPPAPAVHGSPLTR
jgi:hypothetical protein